MESFVTTRIHYKGDKKEKLMLSLLAHISKNVYNSCLYIIRQFYFQNGKSPSLDYIRAKLYTNESYMALGEISSEYIIKAVSSMMLKYIKYHNNDGSIKSYYRNIISKNKDFASFPRYLAKTSTYQLTFKKLIKSQDGTHIELPLSSAITNNSLFTTGHNDELLTKFISESGLKEQVKVRIKIPTNLLNERILLVRISTNSYADDFMVDLVYVKEETAIKPEIDAKIMGIDLGVNNLATCATTYGDSFIIRGRELKQLIRLYNKKIAEKKKVLPYRYKKDGEKFQISSSRAINHLYTRFYNRSTDYINKGVAKVINYSIENDIRTIVIGWNDGLKTGGVKLKEGQSLGKNGEKRINQMFVQMPISRFKDKLANKCKMNGIRCVVVNEAYTSQTSFYDNELLSSTSLKTGFRMGRNFTRANGEKVNADLNAALNIIRVYERQRRSPIEELKTLRGIGPAHPPRGVWVDE